MAKYAFSHTVANYGAVLTRCRVVHRRSQHESMGNAKICRRCGRRNYSGRGGVAVATRLHVSLAREKDLEQNALCPMRGSEYNFPFPVTLDVSV